MAISNNVIWLSQMLRKVAHVRPSPSHLFFLLPILMWLIPLQYNIGPTNKVLLVTSLPHSMCFTCMFLSLNTKAEVEEIASEKLFVTVRVFIHGSGGEEILPNCFIIH